MNLKTWRYVTILLAALAMGMKFAHVLELPPKLSLNADVYITIQANLYGVFGTLGPIIEVGALICAAILVLQVRRTPAYPFTLVSALAILASLAIWVIFVLPANAPLNQWAATQVAPADWARWRDQWQYGQAATFVAHLIGLSALLSSVIRETPDR